MSGADLANVVNEAALLTAREHKTVITAEALEEAVDRVVGGPRRKSHIISEHEKKVVAYHEGRSHAGRVGDARSRPHIQGHHPGPRTHRRSRAGRARNRTKDLMTRSEMIARLVIIWADEPPRNWSSRNPPPVRRATSTRPPRSPVRWSPKYGMSARLGAVRYGHDQGDPFLGRSMGASPILHRCGPRDR